MARFNKKELLPEVEERDREKMKELASQNKVFRPDEDDATSVYELALKKRSMNSILSQAMRDEGFGDSIKKMRWRKRKISED